MSSALTLHRLCHFWSKSWAQNSFPPCTNYRIRGATDSVGKKRVPKDHVRICFYIRRLPCLKIFTKTALLAREREREICKKVTMNGPENYPMKGGLGPNSYAKNSDPQREGIDSAKEVVAISIAENLVINHSPSTPNTFRISDLGCSVGPNTFITVQNIIETVELKFKSLGLSSHIPEFQVFFNDHSSNDFNTLFASLPPERQYFAAGVPGSFHGRLFPKVSLHIIHSSFAVQWLSQVPKEAIDVNSPAWNKGRIHYTQARREVGEAYSAQFARDMETFLRARAEELVAGGLMVLLIPARQDGTLPSESLLAPFLLPLESCLMDLGKEGLLSEAKVDSFNLPIYIPSGMEMEKLVERNGCFNIKIMEPPQIDPKDFVLTVQHVRAAMEGLIEKHFGSEIIDELFDRYAKKFAASPDVLTGYNLPRALVLLLKRKSH